MPAALPHCICCWRRLLCGIGLLALLLALAGVQPPAPATAAICAATFDFAAADIATGSFPASVAVGDLNGDGRLDLAVANYSGDTVSVLLASGPPGNFAPKVDYPTGGNPASVALGAIPRRWRWGI
jgi:hypothetical protein